MARPSSWSLGTMSVAYRRTYRSRTGPIRHDTKCDTVRASRDPNAGVTVCCRNSSHSCRGCDLGRRERGSGMRPARSAERPSAALQEGAVGRHHRARRKRHELTVELQDLRQVRRRGSRRIAVDCDDPRAARSGHSHYQNSLIRMGSGGATDSSTVRRTRRSVVGSNRSRRAYPIVLPFDKTRHEAPSEPESV